MKPPYLRLDLLSLDLERRRGDRTLRELAQEVGVSTATLCRVENGAPCDLATFARLCCWLEADPRRYLGLMPTGRRV